MSFEPGTNELEEVIEELEKGVETKVRSERAKKASKLQSKYEATFSEATELVERYKNWQNELEGVEMYVEDIGSFQEALESLEKYKTKY